jgi:hypothetical protein
VPVDEFVVHLGVRHAFTGNVPRRFDLRGRTRVGDIIRVFFRHRLNVRASGRFVGDNGRLLRLFTSGKKKAHGDQCHATRRDVIDHRRALRSFAKCNRKRPPVEGFAAVVVQALHCGQNKPESPGDDR